MDWNHLQVKRPNIKESDIELKKPVNFEKMIAFAEKLGAGIPFVRIDFYEVDSCLKFGEITFYPATGMEKFDPEDYDLRFGELLVLSCEMKKSF